MLKIVHKYLIREILSPTLIGLIVFTFILLISNLLRLIEMIISKGAEPIEIAQIFLGVIPAFLSLTLPMAFLLGIMIAISRLSSEYEIVALKSSGIGIHQLYFPVFSLSLIMVIINLGITLFAAPASNHFFRQRLFHLMKNRITIGISEKVFNLDLGNMLLYADTISEHGQVLEGMILRISDPDLYERPVFINARKGQFQPSPERFIYLELHSGELHILGEDYTDLQTIRFSDLTLKLDLNRLIPEVARRSKKMKELRTVELWKQANASGNDDPERFRLLTELHRRFAIPFAALAFGIIGLPLGIQSRRRLGRGFGFVSTIFLVLVYYLLLHLGEVLGLKGHPEAMWIPNLSLIFLGLYLFFRAYHEYPFLPIEWAVAILEKLRPGSHEQ